MSPNEKSRSARFAAIEHRDELATRRGRRRANAACEHDDDGHCDRGRNRRLRSPGDPSRCAGRDTMSTRLRGWSRVVAGQRVEEHRHRLQDEHVDVGGDDEHAPVRGTEAAAREGEQRVDEHRED